MKIFVLHVNASPEVFTMKDTLNRQIDKKAGSVDISQFSPLITPKLVHKQRSQSVRDEA